MRRKTGITAVGCIAATAALTSATGTWAQGTTVEPIVVEYLAPASCPPSAAFIHQITQRTNRVRLAVPGEVARRFAVTLEPRGDRFRGELTLTADGSRREVEGATCEEVASAVALIVALAIDPQASTAPVPTPPPVPVPSPPSGPAEPPSLPIPRWTDPWTPLPPARIDRAPWPWPPLAQPLPAVPYGLEGPRWRGAAGLHLGTASAIAPGASFVLGIFGEARLDGAGVASPAFRLGGLISPTHVEETAVGTATFRWFAGELSGCPVRWDIVPEFRLFPCAALTLGAIVVDADSPLGAQTSARPWLSGSVAGRAQIDIAGPLRLEAQLGAAVPFVQDEFFFEPNETVHTTPALGVTALGGVVMNFW